MKCRSVACVWSESPPVHKVTATALLDRPSTLYTGGSDGTIFWWNLSSTNSDHDIKPVAILCGHTAPISDMSICFPASTLGDENSSNVASNPSSVNNYGSLISACTDGVLSVWARDSGHCSRRRKMPAWVGTPYMLQPLPQNKRYVCVACHFIDSLNSSLDNSTSEHGEPSKKPSRCTVVIIDSYTLTIVQTVFRGTLSIGPFKFMSIVTPVGDMEKESVLMADSFGNIQCVSLLKDTTKSDDISDDSQKNSSHMEMSDLIQESTEGELPISFSTSKHVLAILYSTYCIFKLVDGSSKIGEISLLDDQLCQHDVAGCIFLGNMEQNQDVFLETFGVWNNKGYVIMFTVSYSEKDFKYIPLCTIPSVSHPSNIELSFSFVKTNQNLIRIESICLHTEEPVHWKPLITTWAFPNKKDNNQECKLVSKGSYFDEWFVSSNVVSKREYVVTSSMVISENDSSPYAIVYGYDNGEIELLRFNMFTEKAEGSGSPREEVDSCAWKQNLSGHTNAILCLAAHQMVTTSRGFNSTIFLISGSMDSTIRIWDLNSTNLVAVMRHHVQPVRQIILPPPHTDRPWSDCFLSVSEDACVALASLETLRVERMFPGHACVPAKVVWDSTRGYLACFSLNLSCDSSDVLYIWDVKSGARERVLRGGPAHSMFDHFCTSGNKNNFSLYDNERNTSASSLLLPVIEDTQVSQTHPNNGQMIQSGTHNAHPITCSCPFPGIATLTFDLTSLMSLRAESSENQNDESKPTKGLDRINSVSVDQETVMDATEYTDWAHSLEGCLFRFSLSVLHLWDVDYELDKLLVSEMKLKKPKNFFVASGMLGDRGALTLTFPGPSATLELWKSSSEFCAMRSLTMVSLAQHMISLSHSCSTASSALAAFYTRKFAEKFPDIKPPLLQLLISFWQDKSEHVRMAARSLFHCAASRAIPFPLRNHNSNADSEMLSWLESFERQDWISCVGGTSQDAMTSHIVVAAALVVWYPSLIKSTLPNLVIHPLLKLVMAMNDKYTSTAAEILAEGMEGTWSACISSEIPRLISDIFLQIEHVRGQSGKLPTSTNSSEIRESLVGILLPSLAMADVPAFLHVIERQIWSTASDSPVHIVSLMTLIRVIRGSPRNLAPYLDKVVNFILQTMDPGNMAMRRSCLQNSMATLKEVVRVFPMVALNDSSTRLAVGDAIGDINKAIIRVYDMQSMTKIKILDASGPPGLPTLLGGAGASEMSANTAISVLSFSPDGEGLIAFSEHGLMIRWWSVGSMWWEKLSRNLVPVQCTKLIFVPPWEGFSPTSTRSSVMASVMGNGKHFSQDNSSKDLSEMERLKNLLHSLDLSYRLEWVSGRQVLLKRHGQELATFQL